MRTLTRVREMQIRTIMIYHFCLLNWGRGYKTIDNVSAHMSANKREF